MGSSNLCNCPITEINNVPQTTCNKLLGSIRKMAFCREQVFQSVTPNPTVAEIKLAAEWVNTLAARDDTKTVISDFLENVKIDAGDLNSEEISQYTTVNGKKPALVTCQMINADADTILAMNNVACENKLYVYFFNDAGEIIHTYDENGTAPAGFRIMPRSFGVKDKSVDGNSADSEKNEITFQIERNWSTNFEITKPTDFDPLVDLENSGT